ncbi:transcription factor bHLH18-like isoform X2 [Rhodamnia argentea]|uniref:Transcription factor bHLH18-like isoform X2 n=1 Tax=Rhodamnia argentea TaxID=178133 RepID=A0A8B8QN49_9MYRT|nr:transcription factor bHLH18-like isoform X2 [Rhodamnia argentea]
MEILSPRIFPDMVEDAAYFHHHHQQQLNSSFSLDDEFDLFHPYFPSHPYCSSSPSNPLSHINPEVMPGFAVRSAGTPQGLTERPRKQLKTESQNSPHATEMAISPRCESSLHAPSPSRSPDSRLISFGNPDSSPAKSNPFYGTYEIQDCEDRQMKSAGTTSRTPVRSQDHVLAERKRREKLSGCFIALSALIPNLKKMDKATVLEDAIEYLKELQQRVKTLEEEVAVKTVESVVVVKKSQLTPDEDTRSSSNESSCSQIHQQLSLLEIEARVSGKCVLIKIHCEKRNGFTSKITGEIEKLNLAVVNSCVLSFGSSMLDVTILAQMDVGFSLKMGDLERNLRQALLDLI